MLKNWNKVFKLSIINQDADAIQKLLNEMPHSFEHKSEVKEAMALINEAKKIIATKQKELSLEIIKLKKARKFLNT